MSKFRRYARTELGVARSKHPGKQVSLFHGYGVLVEEVREFEVEVFKRSSKRDWMNTATELIQIAAMAQRTAEDVVGDVCLDGERVLIRLPSGKKTFGGFVKHLLDDHRQLNTSILTLHEGYGVLMKYVKSFETEVFNGGHPHQAMLTLFQIAATVERIAEDLELVV